MDWFVDTLQQYPEISIFLSLAMGYWLGGLKLGSFSLGSVTGTLLMGVLIGQMNIPISASVRATCLVAGLVFGWIRSSFRIFEGMAGPSLATMNSVGLNVFIAVVGINAGPGFVAGLGQAGPSLS